MQLSGIFTSNFAIRFSYCNPVVDNGIYFDCDRVPGEDFLRWHIEGHGPQVDGVHGIHTRQYKEEAWAYGMVTTVTSQAENHSSLVLLYN